jgi:hypothetical protein
MGDTLGKKCGDGSMTNHQGSKSRNLITFPLDIPEVEVIRVETNERGDYIVTGGFGHFFSQYE